MLRIRGNYGLNPVSLCDAPKQVCTLITTEHINRHVEYTRLKALGLHSHPNINPTRYVQPVLGLTSLTHLFLELYFENGCILNIQLCLLSSVTYAWGYIWHSLLIFLFSPGKKTCHC